MICIRVIQSSKVFLFKFSKTVVLPVKDFVLRGMEEPIYQHIARRLYRPDLNIQQAQLLGLHLFTEAGSTSTQIGGQTRVVWAMPHGMWALDQEHALRLEAESIAEVQRAMDNLFIACADTRTLRDATVKTLLRDFIRTINALRKDSGKRIAAAHYDHVHSVGHPLLTSAEAKKRGLPVHPLAPQRTKRGRKVRPPSRA